MVSKHPIYFAHPINTYDTSLERAVEQLLLHSLPEYRIESPNQPHHQDGYEKWKAETAESRDVHSAMDYFYKVVMPSCVGCVSLPFLDGRMGLGVAGESRKALFDEKQTWYVKPVKGIKTTQEDLDAFVRNPQNGLFVIREFTSREKQLLLDMTDPKGDVPEELVVPHEETRLRSFFVYGREVRPYVEAHLVSMPVPDGFYPEDK